jgi:hypothetical protein
MARTEGRSDSERGFAVVTTGRSIWHIYPFDRAAALKANAAPIPPSITLWRKTEKYYIEFSKQQPLKFAELLLEEHSNHRLASRGYTLAEVCLQVPRGLFRIQRTDLWARVEELERLGLLPTPLGVCMEDDDGSASSSASSSSASQPPTAAKRTRSSVGGGDMFEEERPPSDFDDSILKEAIELAACVSQQSDEGLLCIVLVEELVLTEAFNDPVICDAFNMKGGQAFERELNSFVTEQLELCGPDFPSVFLSSGTNTNATSLLSPPRQLLRQGDLANTFRRYTRACGGSAASRDRSERINYLREIKKTFFKTQLFCPSGDASLASFFKDRCRFNSRHYRLVGVRSFLATAPSSRLAAASGNESHKTPRKLIQEAVSSPNRHNQEYLSHQSILILQLIKATCEISDKKFLLFQIYIHYLVTGEVPTQAEARRVCITGKAHAQRARQLQWRFETNAVEKINSSKGVIFGSTDDSRIGGKNMGSRRIYYFDEELNHPNDFPLPGSPTARKDGDTGGVALLDACHQKGIITVNAQGGVSDNAPNALKSIRSFVSGAEEAANGLDDLGEVIRTLVNGVRKRAIVIGSPVHQNHLHMGHFRKSSVGGKEDMDTANHLQMAFKWAAIMESDQVVSTKGASSFYIAALNDHWGGRGPWSKKLRKDHEGRWGVSQAVLADIKAIMDRPLMIRR